MASEGQDDEGLPLTTDEQAAEWFVRLQRDGVRAESIDAFEKWRADPDCAAAFEKAQTLWLALDQLADTPAGPSLRGDTRAHIGRRAAMKWGLRAASISVVGIALSLTARMAFFNRKAQAQSFVTVVGQRSTSTLSDGSVMMLDTDSAATADFSGKERRIALTKGRACFRVAKDLSRPFVVVADHQRIIATGTVFDVRLEASEVAVTLVDGQVLVDRTSASHEDQTWRTRATTLNPGERMVARADSTVSIDKVDANLAISWLKGELVFDNIPLADAVKEANRYTHSKIVLANPKIGALRVNGVFNVGESAELVRAVTQALPVTAVFEPGGDIRLEPK